MSCKAARAILTIIWMIVLYFLMTWPHTFKTSRESSVNFLLLALLFVVQSVFFGKSSTTHLGFEYSGDGVAPPREDQNYLNLACAKDHQGCPLLSWFGKLLPPLHTQFADTASPFTSKNVQFQWESTHQHAFGTLNMH